MNSIPDLFGSLYFAALDDQKFNDLIALAETTLVGEDGHAEEFEVLRRECERHIAQAEKLMRSLGSGPQEVPGRPVFDVTSSGRIEEPNQVARELFGLRGGERLEHLIDDPETATLLCRFASGQVEHAPVLRLPGKDTAKPLVLIVETADGDGRARVAGMDVLWHEAAERAMRVLYGLTVSEAEVLGLMTIGHAPADVADLRGRSVETVRQQIRSILLKLEVNGTQDAVHLARAVAVSSSSARQIKPSGSAEGSLVLSDGRVLDYVEQGAADGEAVIFLHGCLGGRRLPGGAATALEREGLRLIAPARPWHGQSAGCASLLEQPGAYAEDLLALADHFGLETFSVLAFDVGAIYALCAAERLEGRLTSLLCAAAQPPVFSLRDFASAPQQQRIFATLARVSPPLLRYLSVLGDRKLKKEGRSAFAETVLGGSRADLAACKDSEILDLMWTGHHFHVEKGSDGFINDCRLIASNWIGKVAPLKVPLRFVHGTEDVSIHAKRITALAQTFQAEVSWVPGAGHLLPFSHWNAVLPFLKTS